MKKTLGAFLGLLVACSPAPSGPPKPSRTLVIENQRSESVSVFVAFGSDSVTNAASFPLLCGDAGALSCSFQVNASGTVTLDTGASYTNATIAFLAPVGCGATKAELNLNNPAWYDTLDVSLVDGFNAPVRVRDGDLTVEALTESGNETAFGVYPLGCDICVSREAPPCGFPVGPSEECKTGTQDDPDVPCQAQSAVLGGGTGTVTVSLLP